MTDKKVKAKTSAATEEVKDEVKLTEAEKIWNEIANVPLEMFSLPDQTVKRYLTPVKIEPSKLYATAPVQAVIPALETALGKKFNIELATKYLIISRK